MSMMSKHSVINWITIGKLCDQSGYSENAIRAKIKKGVWLMEQHWRKAPDGRILFNTEAINNWVEGH
jgi:hypothetical protein